MSSCRQSSWFGLMFCTFAIWLAGADGHGQDSGGRTTKFTVPAKKLPDGLIARRQYGADYAHGTGDYSSPTISPRGVGPSTVTVKTRPYPTSSVLAAQTHIVHVGLADHKFRPEITETNVGDTVEFRFYPTNHSIVRAEYGYPCVPYEMTGSNKHGFFSGFHALDKVLDDPPRFSLKINDTLPIFFYCSAPGSCINWGMVGAINPNGTAAFENQRQLALGSSFMLQPGEPFPDEAPRPSNNPGAPPLPSPPPVQIHTKQQNISTGVIAGIATAGGLLMVFAGLMFFLFRRTRNLKRKVEEQEYEKPLEREDSISSTANIYNPRHPTMSSPEPLVSPSDIHGYHHTPRQRGVALTTIAPLSSSQQQQQHIFIEAPPSGVSSVPPVDPFNRIENCTQGPLVPPSFPPVMATSQTPIASNSTALLSPSDVGNMSSFHPTTSPRHIHLSAISPIVTTAERKLGPYGTQELGIAASEDSAVAPPYGWHLNSHLGPAEMDGAPVMQIGRSESFARSYGIISRGGTRWEEIGRGRENMGI